MQSVQTLIRFGAPRDNRVHLLQIDVPATLCYVVCVADTVPELWAAPAKITHFRHCLQTLLVLISLYESTISSPAVGEWGRVRMDHVYIDANSVAERYLAHSLSASDLAEFEAHIVDCQEVRRSPAAGRNVPCPQRP